MTAAEDGTPMEAAPATRSGLGPLLRRENGYSGFATGLPNEMEVTAC